MAFAITCSANVHRCSRCGKIGHNVRNCHLGRREWYAQRCSSCGEVGHNSRNCAKVRAAERNDGKCLVCSGKGTLPCGRCGGRGRISPRTSPTTAVSKMGIRQTVAAVAPKRIKAAPTINLSAQQREWAKMARARGRVLRGTLDEEDSDLLVGGGNTRVVGDSKGVGDLIGGRSVADVERERWLRKTEEDFSACIKCSRCLGLGYLCCLSCSD